MKNSKIFANKTTLNNKFQVFSEIELPYHRFSNDANFTYDGKDIFNFKSYWLTKKQIEKIEKQFEITYVWSWS